MDHATATMRGRRARLRVDRDEIYTYHHHGSGAWILIGFIPVIGELVLLYWFCSRGDSDKNQFGENPLRTA